MATDGGTPTFSGALDANQLARSYWDRGRLARFVECRFVNLSDSIEPRVNLLLEAGEPPAVPVRAGPVKALWHLSKR